METKGRHLLVEFHGCDRTVLNDKAGIESLMVGAAAAAGATVVGAMFHTFTPQGVSGVVVIEESHLSIHTWPEHGYAAVDFFTCGDCLPERARDVLSEAFNADRTETMEVERGLRLPGPVMRVRRHEVTRGDADDAVAILASGVR